VISWLLFSNATFVKLAFSNATCIDRYAEGKFPAWIGKLSALEELTLANTGLTVGPDWSQKTQKSHVIGSQ
jgi:hypothetical protein